MQTKVPNEETLKFIPENYEYDAETGKLYKFRKWYKDWKETGLAISSNKHYTVKILHKVYQVHNVCWYLYYGRWPCPELDHRDCDPLNNKIGNLKEATSSQNNSNKPNRYKREYRGVEFSQGKYRYSFAVNRMRYSKRGFATAREAAIAREAHLDALGDTYADRNEISDSD